MFKRIAALVLVFVLVLSAVPAANAFGREPIAPESVDQCCHTLRVNPLSPNYVRPDYTGKLINITPQRVEDTLRYLDEVYGKQHPEAALVVNTGDRRDQEALKTLAETITAGCTTDTEKTNAIDRWLYRNIYYDINTSDWIVVRNLDNQDKLNVGSSYTDENGNKLGYDFTFLPWGDRWEKETYQQFIPHFDEYLAKLDEGWSDPFGELSDPLGTDSGNSGGNAGGDRTGTKLDVNGRGILNVYYPAEQFEYDDTYGKLKNEATGVGILIDPMLGATNLAELKQSYEENNSDEDDYSLKETTLNGYKAIIMTYSDWLGATMRIDIDFGGNHDGWYGVSFVVSGDSLSDCDTDVVWSIINSMELVK